MSGIRHVLYLGLSPPHSLVNNPGIHLIHYPVIRTIPRQPSCEHIQRAFQQLNQYTHLLFTSKTAVPLFFEYHSKIACQGFDKQKVHVISVGKATTALLERYGMPVAVTATRESSEGVIEELGKMALAGAFLFWPHSALSRPLITDFFNDSGIAYCDCVLYDTVEVVHEEKPNLEIVDEIIFTSPSTVDAFLNIFGCIPHGKTITPIGEVTEQYLQQV